MLEKARDLPCSAVIFDLEDAVAPNEKSSARESLRTFLKQPFNKPYFVRINSLGTEQYDSDIRSLVHIDPLGIILPKASSEAVFVTSSALDSLQESTKSVRILPLIESALAIETLLPLLDASPRVIGAQFGAEDLTVDLGTQRTARGEEINYARHRVVYGCRAKGLPAYDTPFLDFQNEDGLAFDCRSAKSIGFSGKTCIHPSQIELINQTFTPTDGEIAEAHEIVAAAEQASGGAFALHGKMIDGPVVDRARHILAQQ